VVQVPYSEHSSFAEMREFVQWLRPTSIIPSVGNDSGPKAQRMVQLLTAA
jgi:DNA cross-link repair 1A protein